jgi:hypothetical protein
MTKPISKAAQLRQARRILLTLLRTPKSRTGLQAAVKSQLISRNYVFGFLSEGRRDGTLVTFKSGPTVMYQIATTIVEEVPAEGIYPSWLDPRTLPTATSRLVVIDGDAVQIKVKKNKK